MPNYDKIRGARSARLMDEAERVVESYDLFLAGPYIIVEEAQDADTNSSNAAKRLRYSLYHRFNQTGHRVYLGEDVELKKNGEANYGQLANAVIFERHHILKRTDVLIVLPSSPGSFCEFGDWASDEKICRKMLVIIDQAYQDEVSYINDGVVSFAKHNTATVKYISYEDSESVYSACEEFIFKIAARKRVDELYGRNG